MNTRARPQPDRPPSLAVVNAAEYEAAGLYDPAAHDAADRLALLEYFTSRGLTIDEMLHAERNGLLLAAASDALVRRGRELPLVEVAEASGLSVELLRRVLEAAGVVGPDGEEPRLLEGDVPFFVTFRAGMEVFGEESIVQLTRVIGSAVAQVAEAGLSLFHMNVERSLYEQQASQRALAEANVAAVGALEALESALSGMLRLHFEAAQRRTRRAYQSDGRFGWLRMAVGFVDLVGFTPLAHRLAHDELAAVIEDFGSRAHAVVTAHGGRIVKYMGDEVMFVTPVAAVACQIALGMVDVFRARDTRIEPHGAIAFGSVLARAGDYYGPLVNLAARVADIAVPGEILVSEDVQREAVGAEALAFEPAGRRMLKGFDEPVALWSVSRAGA